MPESNSPTALSRAAPKRPPRLSTGAEGPGDGDDAASVPKLSGAPGGTPVGMASSGIGSLVARSGVNSPSGGGVPSPGGTLRGADGRLRSPGGYMRSANFGIPPMSAAGNGGELGLGASSGGGADGEMPALPTYSPSTLANLHSSGLGGGMYPMFAGGSPFSMGGLFQQTPSTQAQQWFQDNVNPGQKATTPVAGRVGSNLLPAAVAAAAAAASSNGGNEPNASDDLVVRVPRGLSHNLDGIPGHSMTVQGNGGIGVVTSQDAGSNDPAQKSITVTSSKGESLTMSMNQVELLLACLGGILPNAAAQQSVSYPGLSSSLPSPAVGTSLTVPIRIEKMSGDSADGYRWKKYGHKQLKGTDIHRCYYKCKAPNCPVKKQVENKIGADSVNTVIYKGVHNHAKPPPESEVGDAVKAAADSAAATE